METCVAGVCGAAVRSGIGRVCKGDQGGQVVGRDNWTTFLKATLECSVQLNGAADSATGGASDDSSDGGNRLAKCRVLDV